MQEVLDRDRIFNADGGLGSMYMRLIRAFGPKEADAILAAAKHRIQAAPLDPWLDAAIDIAEERHPGAIDWARHRPGAP